MGSVNNIVEKLLNLIERFFPVLIIVVGYFAYKKVSGFFTESEQENAAAVAASQEHSASLVTATKKPLPADKKKAPAVARENVKAADAVLVARVAEAINKYTGFFNLTLMSTRRTELYKIADQMSKYGASFNAVATEYKKIDGNDMTKDLRNVFEAEYATWVARATNHTKVTTVLNLKSFIPSADSLTVAAPSVVGAATGAPLHNTLVLQILAMLLPQVPKIIAAIKAGKARRTARKAAKQNA